MPLLSTFSFHSFSLLISSSSVSAITAKSSAYSSSHGRATLKPEKRPLNGYSTSRVCPAVEEARDAKQEMTGFENRE